MRTNLISRFIGSSLTILAAYAELQAESSGTPRTKIGVSVPISGVAAAYGTDIRNALTYINEVYGKNRYELIIEDDQCNDREAASVARRLVDVSGVKYVLGFGCSGTVLSSAPIYERAKVIAIASGTGAPAITNAGDYIFRTKPTLNLAADLLADESYRRFKNVGLLVEETAYCQGLADAYETRAKAKGVAIIRESFLPGTEDFRSLFAKMKSKGVDALFLLPQGEPGLISIFRQLESFGWTIPLLGTFSPGSPAFLTAIGKRADGIVYADIASNQEMFNTEGQRLYAGFVKNFGKPSSNEHFVSLSFLSYAALVKAIESGIPVKDFLYSHRFTEFADGYSFDANGDVVSDRIAYVLHTIRDGAPAPYENTRN